MDDPLKLNLWRSLLTAELNAIYWDRMLKKYYRRIKNIDVFLAVCTSSTVASWNFWQNVPFLWKTLSVLSTFVAIVAAASNWKKELGQISTAKAKWSQINLEYDQLWSRLISAPAKMDSLRSRYETIRKKELEADKAEPALEVNVKLRNQCHNEVLIGRGLDRQK